MLRAALAWLTLLALASLLEAQQMRVELNPAKTTIAFTLSDVLHTVRGSFRVKQGQIVFDAAAHSISGEVVVDAASGNSGSRTRDRRMTRDILEAQRFPEIRFAPMKLTGSVSTPGASSAEITGSFLIHGQAHQITIPMQIQMNQDEITATGKFTVPYVEWGMKNPSNFLLKVNDKVEIEVTAVGHFTAQ